MLAKIDLEEYLEIKLLEKTDKFTIRSRTDLRQIDGAQGQLIFYRLEKVLLLITGDTVI